MILDILTSQLRAIDKRHIIQRPKDNPPLSETGFRLIVAAFLLLIGLAVFAILWLTELI